MLRSYEGLRSFFASIRLRVGHSQYFTVIDPHPEAVRHRSSSYDGEYQANELTAGSERMLACKRFVFVRWTRERLRMRMPEPDAMQAVHEFLRSLSGRTPRVELNPRPRRPGGRQHRGFLDDDAVRRQVAGIELPH